MRYPAKARIEVERAARWAAEGTDRSSRKVLAHVSHELRTPLGVIIGYAEVVSTQGPLTEVQRQGLETIRRSGEHLLDLIDNILELSRIDAGRIELLPLAIELAPFLSSVADMIRVKTDEKRLTLTIDSALELPAVMVDDLRLRQVLLNLLGNAVKFTDTGTVALRAYSEPIPEHKVRLRLEVEDTGIGIDAEHRNSIFEPFQQAGDPERRRHGTGLGLFITRALVHAMGGELTVESAPGLGSRFTVLLTLPLVHASAQARNNVRADFADMPAATYGELIQVHAF